MNRVTNVLQLIRQDLKQYQNRNLNFPQILFAINKAQENIASTEDVISASIQITIAAGTYLYPVVFSSGTPPVSQDIVKRIKSILYPKEWTYGTDFKTDQEFDKIKQNNPTLPFPNIVVFRNGNLEFWGIPGSNVDTKVLTLQTWLRKQTQDCNFTYDFEIPSNYDEALRYYSDYFLLPVDHEIRPAMLTAYNLELEKYRGSFENKQDYNYVVQCTD